jgi:hypothetical protein
MPDPSLVRVQQWLQNTAFPLPRNLTRTGGDWFFHSQHTQTLQRRGLIHDDNALLHVIANSGLSPNLARVNEAQNEYHIFKMRWPYSEDNNVHPKMDSLMRRIDAKHYALLVGKFHNESTTLMFDGRIIELAMNNAPGTGCQQLLEDPDGQPVQHVLFEDWEDRINVANVDTFGPPFLTYAATAEYPFAEEGWMPLTDIASRVLSTAGWKYDCVSMNCASFCERVLDEICKAASEWKVWREQARALEGTRRRSTRYGRRG